MQRSLTLLQQTHVEGILSPHPYPPPYQWVNHNVTGSPHPRQSKRACAFDFLGIRYNSFSLGAQLMQKMKLFWKSQMFAFIHVRWVVRDWSNVAGNRMLSFQLQSKRRKGRRAEADTIRHNQANHHQDLNIFYCHVDLVLLGLLHCMAYYYYYY